LKALAFQATGQSNGYLPDSTATAFDKRSLRDGHYVPWNQLVYLTKAASVDGGPAQPTNAAAKLVVDILTNVANPGTPVRTGSRLAGGAGRTRSTVRDGGHAHRTEGGPLSLFRAS
jgi:hypothetical protein